MKIEIDVEEMTKIVRESLMTDYDYSLRDDSDFPGLHDAIQKVLKYYMSPSQYEEWLESKGLTNE